MGEGAEDSQRAVAPQEARLDLEAIKAQMRVWNWLDDTDGFDAESGRGAVASCRVLIAEVERLRSPGAGEARLREAAQALAILALQSTRYEMDGEFQDAVDGVLLLVRAGLVPGEKEQP